MILMTNAILNSRNLSLKIDKYGSSQRPLAPVWNMSLDIE